MEVTCKQVFANPVTIRSKKKTQFFLLPSKIMIAAVNSLKTETVLNKKTYNLHTPKDVFKRKKLITYIHLRTFRIINCISVYKYIRQYSSLDTYNLQFLQCHCHCHMPLCSVKPPLNQTMTCAWQFMNIVKNKPIQNIKYCAIKTNFQMTLQLPYFVAVKEKKEIT